MSKSKPKTLFLNEAHQRMIADLMEKPGFENQSAVFYAGLRELHRKYHKDYFSSAKKQENDETGRSEDLEKIAKELNAEIFTENGKKKARYYQYVWGRRIEQVVDFEDIIPSMFANQYSPSREKVEELRAEGKVDY